MTNPLDDACKKLNELTEALNKVVTERITQEQIGAEERWEPKDPLPPPKVLQPGQWVMAGDGRKGRIVNPEWGEHISGDPPSYPVRFWDGIDTLPRDCLTPCTPELWPENRVLPREKVCVVDYPSQVDGRPAARESDDRILAGKVVRVEKVLSSSTSLGPVGAFYIVKRNGVTMTLRAFNCMR